MTESLIIKYHHYHYHQHHNNNDNNNNNNTFGTLLHFRPAYDGHDDMEDHPRQQDQYHRHKPPQGEPTRCTVARRSAAGCIQHTHTLTEETSRLRVLHSKCPKRDQLNHQGDTVEDGHYQVVDPLAHTLAATFSLRHYQSDTCTEQRSTDSEL